MALIKGVNSYVTTSEADSYFEDRMDAAAWIVMGDEMKEQALVTATRMLDQKRWHGSAVDADQTLAFPRQGSYRDSSRGVTASFTSTYTFVTTDETDTSLKRDIRQLRAACYELAYHLANNDGLLDSTGEIKEIKVGPIELKDIKETSKNPAAVSQLIKPMIQGSGRNWEGY
ncbi:DnaT-like ssDNA-binding protein [Planktomarina sp.]|uniref:DnaT-like ssDNA-binding protein n=1 Tax=Planktomarina sp. TaxID=2024851 RepID=UPI0032619811